MYVDKLNEFCDATSVAATAGTALVGNVIDLGATSRDIGNGEPTYLVITTDTEVITAGSAGTITIKLASDAQAAIATDGSATVHLTTAALVTDDAAVNSAVLNAGGVIMVAALPRGTYERYLGILATVATTEVTAGKINAFLTSDPTGWVAYANAI
jgi:hypothetical protein